MKKKIVILGATGFIGTNLLHHFANSGEYEVFATYNRVPFFEAMNVAWKRADLLSKLMLIMPSPKWTSLFKLLLQRLGRWIL